MWQDPIVAEVRQAREAYSARYDYALRAIYDALKMLEQQNRSKKVSFPPKLIVPVAQESEPAVAAA